MITIMAIKKVIMLNGWYRMMLDGEWTVLAGCQVSKAHTPRICAKTCLKVLGGVERWGVLGRSASSWFKRSASSCRVDGGAPVDGACAEWTELQCRPTNQTDPCEKGEVEE